MHLRGKATRKPHRQVLTAGEAKSASPLGHHSLHRQPQTPLTSSPPTARGHQGGAPHTATAEGYYTGKCPGAKLLYFPRVLRRADSFSVPDVSNFTLSSFPSPPSCRVSPASSAVALCPPRLPRLLRFGFLYWAKEEEEEEEEGEKEEQVSRFYPVHDLRLEDR
ncbi:hypothetical protein O3P69_003632 [Scylla paramamosain]|uniref:Uncharacterized protein n=1 Tax=Scylla paramamosain TaxID=85552 RepID=A0AAW0UKP1_SCYPA